MSISVCSQVQVVGNMMGRARTYTHAYTCLYTKIYIHTHRTHIYINRVHTQTYTHNVHTRIHITHTHRHTHTLQTYAYPPTPHIQTCTHIHTHTPHVLMQTQVVDNVMGAQANLSTPEEDVQSLIQQASQDLATCRHKQALIRTCRASSNRQVKILRHADLIRLDEDMQDLFQ